MTIKRLKAYIDFKHISVAAFEKSIGMSNASFAKSLKGGKSIGSDKLERILATYDDLSAEWLLRGEGPMLRTDRHVMTPEQRERLEAAELLADAVSRLTGSGAVRGG